MTMTPHLPHITGLALLLAASAAAAQVPPQPPGQPSDEQVKKDLWRDGRGMLAIETTAGKRGEFEWDPRTRTWFFQRGFIVTREGNLPELPQAKLQVGGLAVYRWTGSAWAFQKELVTFNRYSGIPAPSDDELLGLVSSHKERIFAAHQRHMPEGLGRVALAADKPPRWHNANSMSYWVQAEYAYRVPSTGQVVPCTTVGEVRIYRNGLQAPWRDPVGLPRQVVAGCGAPGR